MANYKIGNIDPIARSAGFQTGVFRWSSSFSLFGGHAEA